MMASTPESPLTMDPARDSGTTPDFAGGPRYQVIHRTVFEYALAVSESVNTLRLEPRTFPFQKTLTAFIRVLPATRLGRFTDLFENISHHFEIQSPHQRLEIESRLKIQNLPLRLPDTAYTGDSSHYNDPEVWQTTWPYTQESRYVSKLPQIWRQAVDLTRDKSSIYEKSLAIMHWVHSNFRYDGFSTHVNTHLQEAFDLRAGVCQDFTHVMIGLCRSMDIPARYASGYIYNGERDNLVGAQASHAWPEIYLPEVGWIGFDPTNDNLADERYIKVAVGRDYDDVAPIKGGYKGTAQCRMNVTVDVERIV